MHSKNFHKQSKRNTLKNGIEDFPGGAVDKNLPANARHTGLVPGLGRFSMPQSNHAYAPQPLSPHSRAQKLQLRAHMPQLLKPMHLELVLHHRRSHHNDKPVHGNKE